MGVSMIIPESGRSLAAKVWHPAAAIWDSGSTSTPAGKGQLGTRARNLQADRISRPSDVRHSYPYVSLVSRE